MAGWVQFARVAQQLSSRSPWTWLQPETDADEKQIKSLVDNYEAELRKKFAKDQEDREDTSGVCSDDNLKNKHDCINKYRCSIPEIVEKEALRRPLVPDKHLFALVALVDKHVTVQLCQLQGNFILIVIFIFHFCGS